MSDIQLFHSEYYDKNFTPEQLEEAHELYLAYCEREALEAEVSDIIEASELNPVAVEHVLYHAEINGMEI